MAVMIYRRKYSMLEVDIVVIEECAMNMIHQQGRGPQLGTLSRLNLG